MRAILIDPFKQEVREVENDFSDFRVIQHYLRFGELDVLNMTELGKGYPLCLGPRIDSVHHMYVDDEGLYRKNQRYFYFGDYPQALAGYGLILALGSHMPVGCPPPSPFRLFHSTGEEQSCTKSVEYIQSLVRWEPSETVARLSVPPTMITSFGPHGEEHSEIIPIKFPDHSGE